MRCRWLVAALTALLWSAPTGAFLPPPYGGSLTVPLPDEPVTLDPAHADRESELQLIGLIFDTLYRVGPDGQPGPHLVHPDPEVSEDGRTWRLTLRAGVEMHDRKLLTAAHVAAALNRLRGAPNAYVLGPIRSASAEGDHVVVLRLHRPSRQLRWLLSAPATAVAIRAGKGRWIGSGPFALRRWTGSSLKLVAHATHFAGRPYLDEVTLKVFHKSSDQVAAFQMGWLQMSFHGTSLYGGRPKTAVAAVQARAVGGVFLRLGTARPYLAEPAFRRALLRGIDRKRLVPLAGTGESAVAHSPVSPRLLRGRFRPVGFDRRAANRALARLVARNDALHGDASSGRLKLALILDASRLEDRIVANQIVADLDRIGISITVDPLPARQYGERLRSGRFELAICRPAVQLPLGSVGLATALAAAGERRAALRCLRSGRCGARRARRFMKQLPMIPLVHAGIRLHHDARVGAVQLSAVGRLPFADLYWLRRGAPGGAAR